MNPVVYYIVKVVWEGGKETKYRAPASSKSPERAAFDVAVLWSVDFNELKSKKIQSIEVETLSYDVDAGKED